MTAMWPDAGLALIALGALVLAIGQIRHGRRITAADAPGNVLLAAGWALYGSRILAAVFAVLAVLAAWLWWRGDRRKRKGAALIGAKSRALRDAIVRRAREAARPRPVLRPAPGGAG
jgi:membrane protein implicated in regulation of membrane protease activity